MKFIVFISYLSCLVLLSTSSSTPLLYVVAGQTGPGKSSFINMMNGGSTIAIEGSDYLSETNSTQIYNTSYSNIRLMDTPGFNDIGNGLTNNDIYSLIKASLILNNNKQINGIILVFDSTLIRLDIASNIEHLLNIFKPEILSQTLFIFNKINQLTKEKKLELFKYSMDILLPIYNNYNIKFNKNRIILLDTKNNINKYSNILKNSMLNYGNNKISILTDNEINQLIEKYYQKELLNNENYKIIIDNIPKNEIRHKTVIKQKLEYYTDRCPHRVCQRFLFFRDCWTEYRPCTKSRYVDTPIDEEYVHKWIEKKERKELKYDEVYLRIKARQAIVKDIQEKIYAKVQEIKKNKTKNKQEI